MLAKATMRLSAPSSSRMLLTTLRAMNSMTSEPIGTPPSSALARRMAMRVSRSGAVRSAMRPHSKRRAQALLEGQDGLGRSVAGQDDLLAVLVDGIERMEELFLRPLLVRDELDVVDEQQVDPPVAGAELVDLALLDAGDELVGELLATWHRRRACAGSGPGPGCRWRASGGSCRGPRRRTGRAGCRRGRVARRPTGGGMGQPVGRADDEVAERVARVEVGRAALAADPRGLDPDVLAQRCRRRARSAGRPRRRRRASPSPVGPTTKSTWTL